MACFTFNRSSSILGHMPTFPRYPILHPAYLPLFASLLAGRERSFRADAHRLAQMIQPQPVTIGSIPEPAPAGLVLAVNHYHRPGFGAWWIALSLASVLPYETHWLITSAWVYPDSLRTRTITPLSRWVLRRIAKCYHFTPTPPMPPQPQDYNHRAAAVRKLLRTLDRMPLPVLGIAPEGADACDGTLQVPAPGVDHLLRILANRRLLLVPVGIHEADGQLRIQFGAPVLPGSLNAWVEGDLTGRVMSGIAALLPPHLRGAYA